MWFCYPRGATEGNLGARGGRRGGGEGGEEGGREERRGGGEVSIAYIINNNNCFEEIKESKKLTVAANQMQH